MHKLRMNLACSLIVSATICGFVAQAQRNEDTSADNDITLADLGVTGVQKMGIKALWELKRENQIQALKNLKTLNRLAKDLAAAEDEKRETLLLLRQRRLTQKQQIQSVEGKPIETLPVRAQLHLTILDALENGLARRIAGTRTQRVGESSNKKDDEGRENQKRQLSLALRRTA